MPGIPRAARSALAVVLLCAAPALVRGVEGVRPEPELPVALEAPEPAPVPDAFPRGDPRRGAALVGLALRRHAAARAALADEQVAFEVALTQWREATVRGSVAPERPARATPRADALRSEAVAFALRALEESPDAPELAEALVVGGVDADALGRSRDALRLLGTLIRRHPASAHVADAWLAIAEHHIRNGELTRARLALDEAVRRGRPAVRAWAAARMAELQVRVREGAAGDGGASAPRG